MALTAKLLQLRPKSPPIPNPSFTHFFSSTSSDNEPNPNPKPTTNDATSSQSQPQSSMSSYFSDVKASLKQPPPRSSPPRKPFNFSSSTTTPPSKIESLEEIRKNLSEFRIRTAAPLPPLSGDGKQSSYSHSQPISFQELYNRNVINKGPNNNTTTDNQLPAGKDSFDAIRQSLRQLRSSPLTGGVGQVNDSMSLLRLKESVKLRPGGPNVMGSPVVIGGSDNLPLSVFGKELRDKKESDRDKDALRTEFLKNYNYPELGEKLKILRPEKEEGNNWFNIKELNERLIKLREYEEKESDSRIGGVSFKDIRESLVKLKISEDDRKKSTTMQRLDVLGQIGGTPNFMLSPPKEHLIVNYFHPDNMSSAEKLKLELKKVRDEFKKSDSDCGSARVQVAQLTTKIKHLSTALHKKDKHSRKGLVAMVQKRKKLLKYLRRTDWDSYCLVLSKLGLRDNPDYKA